MTDNISSHTLSDSVRKERCSEAIQSCSWNPSYWTPDNNIIDKKIELKWGIQLYSLLQQLAKPHLLQCYNVVVPRDHFISYMLEPVSNVYRLYVVQSPERTWTRRHNLSLVMHASSCNSPYIQCENFELHSRKNNLQPASQGMVTKVRCCSHRATRTRPLRSPTLTVGARPRPPNVRGRWARVTIKLIWRTPWTVIDTEFSNSYCAANIYFRIRINFSFVFRV